MRSLLVASLSLVACGSVAGGPDAAPPATDAAATIDAVAGGDLTVRVFSTDVTGSPAVGTTVLFHDGAGALLAERTTDGGGEVVQAIGATATVTVVRVTSGGATLASVLAAEPGDVVEFGQRNYYSSSSLGSATVNFTLAAGATSHMMITPCGSSSVAAPTASVMTTLTTRCGSTVDVLAISSTDAGPQRYVLVEDAPLAAGGALAVPNAWQLIPSLSVTMTNIPPSVDASLQATAANVLDGRSRNPQSTSYTPPTSTQIAALKVPPVGEASQFDFYAYQAGASGYQTLTARTAATTSFTIDLGAALQPWLAPATLDLATGTLGWTTATGGAATPTMVVGATYYTRPSTKASYAWRVYAPGDATSITLPTLPAALAAYAPTAGDAEDFTFASAFAFEAGVTYAQVRGVADRNGDLGELWVRTPGIERVAISVSESLF